MTAYGFVDLATDDDTLTARIDFENCQVSGGTSIIEDVQRPHRVSLTKWDGVSPRRATIAVVFDGHANTASQRPGMDALKAMARPTGQFKPPPNVTWDTGGVLQFDRTRDRNAAWWIEDLQWDNTDSLVSFANSQQGREPTRQFVNVMLVEVVEAETVGSVAKRKRPAAKKSASSSVYTVKTGDTLQRIAQIKLHDSKRWPEIKALNPTIHDPKKLKAGSKIVLPAIHN